MESFLQPKKSLHLEKLIYNFGWRQKIESAQNMEIVSI